MLLLIPLLPFVGFLVNTALGRRLPQSLSGGIACLAMIAAFLVSAAASWPLLGHGGQPAEHVVFTWLPSGDLQVPFALRVDQLSALMILVVTGIGSLIHIYSVGYMHEETDSEDARYFSYLNLFASFMLVLVLGSNFPVMFIGWEGVGLCSYLLIGFYYKKQSASDAGKKAFVVNRIGDFGFILGMLLIFVTFGTLDFQGVAAGAAARAPETLGMGVMTVATLLLFVGATGKSAQIPLHVWLPDAMEGPTPVSALIHAATMVTAGVYMIGRNAVLFSHAPMTLEVVAGVGVATALMAERSVSCRPTSNASWPTQPCRSWATCSWRWAWEPTRRASSTSTRTRSSRRCCSLARARSSMRSPANRICGRWAGSRNTSPSHTGRSSSARWR